MSFEHEQFRRFLQNDCHSPTFPSSSPNMGLRIRPSIQLYQPPKINGIGNYQQQQVQGRRRHYSSSGKKVRWSKDENGKRCESLTPRVRVAALIVCLLKLTILCCWLLHELTSGFDESLCLLLTTNISQKNNIIDGGLMIPNTSPQISTNNKNNNLPSLLNLSTPKNEADSVNDNEGVEVLEGRQTNADMEQQRIEPNKMAQNKNQSPSNPFEEQFMKVQSPPAVPKRRRKVILRRRLLRKGTTGIGGHSSNKQSPTADGIKTGSSGTVRRVIWRVVPLKKLPMGSETTVESEELNGVRRKEQSAPMRTKTGIVMLRMTSDQQQQKLRRTTRRQTTNKNTGRSDGETMAEIDMSSMIQESAWRKKSWKRAGTEISETEEEEDAIRVHQSPKLAAIYSSMLNEPEQLNALINFLFCYARTIFDCWCLIQCFCSALFLLGLHIRHRIVALFTIVVDFVSIILGLIIGISAMMFPLILLFILPNHPTRLLLLCLGISASIYMVIAIYAWSTFIQLKAFNSSTEKEKKTMAQVMRTTMGRKKSTGSIV